MAKCSGGSILCLDVFPQLAQRYGDVFSIRLGGEKMVFVCGYKMVKETIVTQADNFVDRPYSALNERVYVGDKGLQITVFCVFTV